MYFFHPILLPSSSMLIPNCSDAVSAICNDACNFCSNYLSNFLGTSTCGTVSERSRIHRLLQRGQKRSATATAITMFGSKVISLDRFAGSRFASFFNYYAHFFIINCALLTIYFTHRTKYIKIFIYNIQEFRAIHVNSCYDNRYGLRPAKDVNFEARSL